MPILDKGVLDSSGMESGSPLYKTVRNHYLFSGLEQSSFDVLAAHLSAAHVEKGDVHFHRGDPASSFFYLDTGMIELNLIAASGEKKVLEVVSPGRTFAEAIAFMREQKYPVTAEALVDSTLCQIRIDA